MQKYVAACNNDTRRAMTLYRYNLKLSQELFTIISCFEVVLRNRVDKQMLALRGNDWLRDAILPSGALYYDRRVENNRLANIDMTTHTYSKNWTTSINCVIE